ncbi:choice-of-anchor A family protein [Nocardioides anomalus]|uniref:Choice-of-anchor A family protein n=1 Tax=Nocardioides anomalus TaxID=2712223 RepID=A0A6G6WI57_9ACTN|nr:choice-of-anchor A family protein [Nocardioides anomalus]QIG44833.1 choice-of-anchor A family protein [Nocardioides anomalus]
MASDACPVSWPALHAGAPEAADGAASVLVGGDLVATGSADGAEGVVVVRGNATFALDAPGGYRVGTTGTGSQVTPYAGSDVLTVGASLAVAGGTTLDVGAGLGADGGDVVVGEQVARDSATDLHGGRVYVGFPDAVDPYRPLLADLAARSTAYASTPDTGQAEVTDTAITLTGDGTSDPQVFTVDGASLGPVQGAGRSLQLLGVPAGASVVVNLAGPEVALTVDSLLAADGTPIDPTSGSAFPDLATHLLWNAPGAGTVDLSGQAPLPGSLLVPAADGTTTIAGGGTNGRVLVGGDLVHTGPGAMHSYPFPADGLRCGPALEHRSSLSLDVELQDPDGVVDPDRFFQGTLTCDLDGRDVTPGDGTWRQRAGKDARLVAGDLPVGALCTVTEQLQVGPGKGYEWADPAPEPAKVRIAKRDPKTVVVSNRVKALPAPPSPPVTLTADPTPEPVVLTNEPTPTPTSQPTDTPDPTLSVGPTTLPEPTNRPTPSGTPTVSTAPEPTPSDLPTADASVPGSDAPRAERPSAPLTSAPFTLRGSFVWAPLLLLSVLTLLLKTRRRPKRLH